MESYPTIKLYAGSARTQTEVKAAAILLPALIMDNKCLCPAADKRACKTAPLLLAWRKKKQKMGGRLLNIHESAEDYLERILMLKEELGHVRSIDIAKSMEYSKPSVSVAMKQLRENGYITVAADGGIDLTEKGMHVAARVYERHRVLTHMLTGLGVNRETAWEDACKIEHDISEESFESIKAHLANKGMP